MSLVYNINSLFIKVINRNGGFPMNVMYENIPIFARIAEGIKDEILSGTIKEGEQLPSTTQI